MKFTREYKLISGSEKQLEEQLSKLHVSTDIHHETMTCTTVEGETKYAILTSKMV